MSTIDNILSKEDIDVIVNKEYITTMSAMATKVNPITIGNITIKTTMETIASYDDITDIDNKQHMI